MSGKSNGFVRAIVGETTIDLSAPEKNQLPPDAAIDSVRVVVDRLAVGSSEATRITESFEIAFQQGQGVAKF